MKFDEVFHKTRRIAQGALGFGVPHGDICVGSQHRVLLEHIRVPLMFGANAVLVRAKSLTLSHEGINIERAVTPDSYIQITLTHQGIIFAEGVAVETILPDGECNFGHMTVRLGGAGGRGLAQPVHLQPGDQISRNHRRLA